MMVIILLVVLMMNWRLFVWNRCHAHVCIRPSTHPEYVCVSRTVMVDLLKKIQHRKHAPEAKIWQKFAGSAPCTIILHDIVRCDARHCTATRAPSSMLRYAIGGFVPCFCAICDIGVISCSFKASRPILISAKKKLKNKNHHDDDEN